MLKADKLYERLIAIVGPSRVQMDKRERLLYSHDLAPLPKEMELAFKMVPDAVVLPRSAAEISEIMKLAAEEQVPVIPRGGASWGFGGSVPVLGGIVLDISAMNRILRLDKENLEVEVEAGAVWKDIYTEAMKEGLFIGSYPSSAPIATVAGWINTGGIGIGTYKYGSVVNNLRDMEVVLPEGQIINTGFRKVSDHSAGYNLNGMFIGSEGTLGIITKVTLKAFPKPPILKPITIQFKNLADSFRLLKAITRASIMPLNISYVDEYHVGYLKEMGKTDVEKGALLNIMLEGSVESVAIEEKAIEAMMAEHGGARMSDEVAAHEWDERYFEFRGREVGTGAALGEVVVPLNSFPNVLKQIYSLINEMKMEASVIGMLGDRNTVVILCYFFYNEKKTMKSLMTLSFTKKLGDIAFENGGRPLGLGLFFASNLPKIRGQGASLMFDLKSTLDPHDIMNPGKTVEGLTRFGIPLPGKLMQVGMNLGAFSKKMLPADEEFKKKVKDYESHLKKISGEAEERAGQPSLTDEEIKELLEEQGAEMAAQAAEAEANGEAEALEDAAAEVAEKLEPATLDAPVESPLRSIEEAEPELPASEEPVSDETAFEQVDEDIFTEEEELEKLNELQAMEDFAKEAEVLIACLDCGTELDPDSKACHVCGADVAPQAPEGEEVQVQDFLEELEMLGAESDGLPADEIGEPDAEPAAEDQMICPTCGEPVNTTMVNCPNCGQEFAWEILEDEEVAFNPVEAAINRLPDIDRDKLLRIKRAYEEGRISVDLYKRNLAKYNIKEE